MSYSSLLTYIRSVLNLIPSCHFVVIIVLSLSITVCLSIWKKYSVYSALFWGSTVFFFLFILEAAIFIRFIDGFPHSTRYDFEAEFSRLVHGSEVQRIQIILNFLSFVPFGFCLSESLSSIKQYNVRCRLGYVTMVGFGLSLFIECLQLIFQLGLFELTDLIMNTVGVLVGTSLAVMGRFAFEKRILDSKP